MSPHITPVTKRNFFEKSWVPSIVPETLKKSTKAIVIICSNLFCVSAALMISYYFRWDPDELVIEIAALVMALSLGTIIGIKLAK